MILTRASNLAAVNMFCTLMAHLTLMQLIAVRVPVKSEKTQKGTYEFDD